MARYDDSFFEFFERGAQSSAEAVTSRLQPVLGPGSVLDVGCGRGFWLRAWESEGCSDIIGVDGDYVSPDTLAIKPSQFVAHDLTAPLNLGRRFDLVECLEVAEHLPSSAADTLIESLVRHGDIILFSAAVPGQGGIGHVNEQSMQYWRARFRQRGFKPFDYVRRVIQDVRTVEWWYRYNALLYVSDRVASELPEVVQATRIAEQAKIPNVAPLGRRMAQAVLRFIPPSTVSRVNSAFIARARRSRD